jgi:predicted PurR-regulated permease PerM
MMSTLLENPIGIGIFGAIIIGLLVFAAAQLGNRRVFYAAGGVLGVTVILVLVSISIETDEEKLNRLIQELAVALRNNDHNEALSFIHPNAVPILQRAQQDLSSVEFKEAKVTSVRSTLVNSVTRPPTATIEFIGYIKASSDRYTGGIVAGGPRLFKLYWVKHQDRWLIRDYEHSDVRAALMN